MDYTDCLIIKTLKKEMNITTAAQKLFITQPALTYRIKALEKELDTTLLIRTRRGVMFTSEGIMVERFAQEFIKGYDDLKNALSKMQNDVRGTVNVVVSRAFTNILPELLSGFCKNFPKVHVFIKTDLSSNCIEQLRNEDVHLALIRGKHNLNCEQYLLHVDPIVLVAKKKINLEDLPRLPYIKYDTDVTLENDIRSWWYENFTVPPNTILHINNSRACREMVASEIGFSILPSIAFDKKKEFDFYELGLIKKNNSLLSRQAWLVYNKQADQILAVEAFINYIKKYFNVQKK